MTLKTSGSGAAELDVVTDAEQHGSGCPALLDNEGPALVIDAAQKLAEIRAGAQGRNHYRAVLTSGWGGHELSISLM
jgi:hypothetical protein